jgi:hypothetical protein
MWIRRCRWLGIQCKCPVYSVVKTKSVVVKSRIREGGLNKWRGNESVNQKRRERNTHYPVPNDVKVGKELEMTSGVDMTLYSCDQGHWHEQNNRY